MSWIKNKWNSVKDNPNSVLNKFLDNGSLGTVGEISFENSSLVNFGLSIVIAGVVLLIFYKIFVQKNS